MYVHIGGEKTLCSEDMIGIFDMERTTVSSDTREYLGEAAKKGYEVGCTDDFPRSFVVTFKTSILDEKVYITRISTDTIKKRCRKFYL